MRVYASAEMTLTDTNDGISITGIDRYYMASSSSEGIKVSSQGWMPEPQKTNPVSRYHWSYEVVNYSSGPPVPSKPAIIGVYGRDGIDAVTVSLSSESHTFAGTESKAIASSITIDISAFKGNQRVTTSIGTVTGGITGQLTHDELGRDTTNNKLVINVKSALDKSHGTLSIPIEADGRTFNKVFSWSVAFKGKVGDKGDTGATGPRGATGSQGPRGAQGTSVDSITEYYLATTSGSGVTTSTSGWTETMQPMTSSKKYLWNYEKINFSDGTSQPTIPVIMGVYGDQGPQGSTGATGRSITGITEYYLATSASSGVTRSTSGWKTTMQPTTPTNKYLWNYERITWSSGTTTTYVEPIIIGVHGDKGDTGPQGPQGATGPRGATGSQGPRGNTGTSVESITEYYLATSVSSGILSTNTGFKTTMQPLTATNKYLWNYEKINFSDGTSQPTIPVIIGVYGDKGQTGGTGATGRSIVSITEHYLATSASSGVTRSTSGWDTKMQPTTETDRYLWNYETIKWSSAPLTTYVEPIIIGVHGAKGPQGPQGPQGIQGPSGSNGQSQWVHIRYSDNPTGSGMEPSPSSTTKYVGIAVTNSAKAPPFPEFTWSKYVGENGDEGPRGLPGKNGTDGTTTYTWIRYADEKDGTGFHNFPDGKKFIGLAFNQTTPDESDNPNDYQWSAMYDEEAFKGVGLADKTEALSGTDIFTDKADDSVAHVEIDGKSYQSNSITNLFTKKTVSGSAYSVSTGVRMQIIQGRKYYTRRTFTSGSTTGSYGSIRMLGTDRHNFTGNGQSGDYSEITEYTGKTQTGEIMFYGSSGTPAGGKIEDTFIIDLTGHFGSGNEPSVNEMDKITDALGWFSGNKIYSERISESRTIPSPEYPTEIHNLNNFDVVSSVGKRNLVPKYTSQEWSHHSLSEVSDYQLIFPPGTAGNSILFLDIEPNVDYTATFRTENARYYIYEVINGELGNIIRASTNNDSYTFNSGSLTQIRISINTYSGNIDLLKVISAFTLKKTSTITEWTPAPEDIPYDTLQYGLYKSNLLLDEPLRSVGDVKDRLFRDSDGLWKVERNVGNVIFDENTTLSRSVNRLGSILYWIPISDKIYASEYISTHYKWIDSIWSNLTEINVMPENSATSNPLIGAIVDSNEFPTVDAYKEWLKNNNVSFFYQSLNPSIETLSSDIQDKLNNLRSFQDSNYVYTVFPDKSDIISENLKPTLHATFKGGGWYSRWKTEDELRKHQAELDNKAGSTELNDTLTIVREEREKLGDIRTDLENTKSNLLITHSEEWMNTITETANDIGGISNRIINIEQTKEQIDTFFKFDDALTIAKSNAQTKLRLTNDEIQFLDGETKGTYITGNNMVTQNLTIQDKLNLPNHTMESQEDLTIIRFIG